MLVFLFGAVSLAIFVGPFVAVIMLTLSDRMGNGDKGRQEDRW